MRRRGDGEKMSGWIISWHARCRALNLFQSAPAWLPVRGSWCGGQDFWKVHWRVAGESMERIHGISVSQTFSEWLRCGQSTAATSKITHIHLETFRFREFFSGNNLTNHTKVRSGNCKVVKSTRRGPGGGIGCWCWCFSGTTASEWHWNLHGQEDLITSSTAEFCSATGNKSQAAATRFNSQFHLWLIGFVCGTWFQWTFPRCKCTSYIYKSTRLENCSGLDFNNCSNSMPRKLFLFASSHD